MRKSPVATKLTQEKLSFKKSETIKFLESIKETNLRKRKL